MYATPYLFPVYTTVNVFVAASFPAGTPGNFTAVIFPVESFITLPPAAFTLSSSTVNPSGI